MLLQYPKDVLLSQRYGQGPITTLLLVYVFGIYRYLSWISRVPFVKLLIFSKSPKKPKTLDITVFLRDFWILHLDFMGTLHRVFAFWILWVPFVDLQHVFSHNII